MATRVPAPKPESVAAPALVGGTKGEEKGVDRPVVRIIRCSTRLLDEDNLWGSVKPLLDQLRASKLILGDRPDQISLEVTQEKVKDRKDAGTQIEIECE